MRHRSFIFATITAAAVVGGTASLVKAAGLPLAGAGASQETQKAQETQETKDSQTGTVPQKPAPAQSAALAPVAGQSGPAAVTGATGTASRPEAHPQPDASIPLPGQAKTEDLSKTDEIFKPEELVKPQEFGKPQNPGKPEAARPDQAAKPQGSATAGETAAPTVIAVPLDEPATPAQSATAAQPAGPKSGPHHKPAAAGASMSDKEIDPEPDVAITPPPAAAEAVPPGPAADPLANAHADAALPASNQAIKAALEKRQAVEFHGADAAGRRKQRDAIAAFYAARDFAPVWSDKGVARPAAAAVIERLAHAGDDALNIPNAPASLKAAGSEADMADGDLVLSEAAVAYARQATGSRIDPRSISPLIGLKPVLANAADVLKDVPAAGAEAGDKLQAYNPSEPRYAGLRKKLTEMRAAHTPAVASKIPAGPDLRVGMSDPRVPFVRARFSLDGTPDSAPQNLRYDTEVAAAVAGFQRANGLPASGVLTKRTIAALSGGQPSRLEGELIANMEMWRWMPRDLTPDRIEVNIPDYQVTVYRDSAPASVNRVVVGKTKTPTPLFSNAMKYLIVNPYWNVPESIVRKEMMPKMGEGGIRGFDVSYAHGRMVVKQPPGPRNALGRIKFMFPNDYAVYLHDTPSKGLFASKERAFSHGCVRVDQPFRFGATVLGANNGWSEKRLTGMLGNAERYVYLPKPLPVHIEYFTASVDEAGHLALRDDVYDYVHKVAAALGREG